MSSFNNIFVPGRPPIAVEIDPSCRSVYVRFKKAAVSKTIAGENRGDCIITMDVTEKGELIGIELIGVKEFSIAAIRGRLPERMKNVDFERARFMSVPNRDLVPA